MGQKNLSRHRKNLGLGNLESHQVDERGVLVTATNGWLRADLWAEGIVRVRAGRHDEPLSDFSYALVGSPAETAFSVTERKIGVFVETNQLHIEIWRSPMRILIYKTSGETILEDDMLGLNWIGNEATVYKRLQQGERFLGLGEKTGPLDRRGRSYVNWNTDQFGYGPDSDPLYASIPFFIGVHPQAAYGFFLNNSYKSTFNFGASSDRFAWYSVEDGQMDYFVIHYPTVAEILQAYAGLTGLMPLPPKWALGFQQCRYSYYPDVEVLRIAETFREKKIPADVIYLDIHYMDAFKVFSWHKTYFPDPKALSAKLAEMGFKLVLIVDPGIKVEPGYPSYDTGIAGDHFAKLPDGEAYKGQVWPGWSHFPDFTAEKTRAWWGAQLSAYTEAGIEGFWNDMNEPAAWGQHLPNLIEFDFEGEGGTFKEARNVYGLEMARATLEGAQKLLPNRRIFNLTRAGFSGIQRYAAVWTGDNTASDEHMMAGQRLVTSLGLSGVAFAGYDIGGFVGEPSPALYARWMALGAFTPFFRAHSMINSRDAEPWAFGEEVEDVARNYISLRYRLMPYLYNAFYEAATTGMPVARSLAIEWPQDQMIYQQPFDSSYMFGPAILVVPVESHHRLTKVYLPQGAWYDWYEDKCFEGGRTHIVEPTIERMPLFVRAGAVIAMQDVVQSTGAAHSQVLQLHVYGGDADYETNWYEDDGATNAQLQGQFAHRQISHQGASRILKISAQAGSFSSEFKRLRILFHGLDELKSVSCNGQAQEIALQTFRLVEPISQFDPFRSSVADAIEVTNVPSIEFALEAQEIIVRY